MSLPFIDLKSQFVALESEVRARVDHVFNHGQYIMGPEVAELEQKLSQFTGAKYCITVSSGTEALLISLMALGVGRGDEIVTTPFTFVATAEVISLLGAKPVFVDVEPDTCNICVAKIEEKITKNTKAIIPVSLYGQPADMDEINEIATRHGNIPVIEDAAQSFGATYKDRKSCNLSKIGCTSFFPSKPLGCYGDGGAIFTSDVALAEACRQIRVHGQSERYLHTRVGVGGRMDTIQCAIVLAKLTRFEWEIQKRIELGELYNQLLDGIGVDRIVQRFDRSSVFAQYTIILNRREEVRQKLSASGVPTAVHYPVPLNEQPAYIKYCCPECTPVASSMSQRVMSLPMSPDLSPNDLKRVVSSIQEARCA